jgi:predicted nuclease of predicted toxin-antitoxin system
VKILLDHNPDWRLKKFLPGHDVHTVFEMGWSDFTNGALLDVSVESALDVLLTADANIRHQQHLRGRPIAMVILCATNNRLATHVHLMPQVAEVLRTISSGEIVEVREQRSDEPE